MFLLKFRLYFATGFSAALYHSQFLPISIYCSPFNSEMELNVTLVPQDLNLELISRELNTLSLFMQLELYVRGKYWDMNSSILFVMVLIIKFSLIV